MGFHLAIMSQNPPCRLLGFNLLRKHTQRFRSCPCFRVNRRLTLDSPRTRRALDVAVDGGKERWECHNQHHQHCIRIGVADEGSECVIGCNRGPCYNFTKFYLHNVHEWALHSAMDTSIHSFIHSLEDEGSEGEITTLISHDRVYIVDAGKFDCN